MDFQVNSIKHLKRINASLLKLSLYKRYLIFLIAKTKYHIARVKGRTAYFSVRFLSFSPVTWFQSRAAQQRAVSEEKPSTVCGRQERSMQPSGKQQHKTFLLLYIPSTNLLTGATHTQGEAAIIHIPLLQYHTPNPHSPR